MVSFSIFLFFLYKWFKDIIIEATFEGHHSFKVQKGIKFGMMLFIASEIMFVRYSRVCITVWQVLSILVNIRNNLTKNVKKAFRERSGIFLTILISNKVIHSSLNDCNNAIANDGRIQNIFYHILKPSLDMPAWHKNPYTTLIKYALNVLHTTIWEAKSGVLNMPTINEIIYNNISVAHGRRKSHTLNSNWQQSGRYYAFYNVNKETKPLNLITFTPNYRQYSTDITEERGKPVVTQVVNNEVEANNTVDTTSTQTNKTIVLYREVWDTESLRIGLKSIKSSSPGIDGQVKADISDTVLLKLQKDLKAQKYQPKPNRRIQIPKPNGGVRYLGIATTRDKIVQAALKILLERIVEPQFSSHSFGFRPNKGCHDALWHIRHIWQNVTWVISCDIEKCFDKIHHGKLIDTLEPLVDQSTLELIKKLLKAGYIDTFSLNDRTQIPAEGVPQGSILSPLLCNIYLNILDTFIEKELLPVYNFGEKRVHNKDYLRLKYVTKEEQNFIALFPELKTAVRRVKHQRMINQKVRFKDTQDPNFSRLYYARYADDFLLGYVGSKATARIIYDRVIQFLQEKLSFNCNTDKSSITHGSKKIKFLGTMIRWIPPVLNYKTEIGEEVKQVTRIAHNKPEMTAPIVDIFARMADNGFAIERKSNKKLVRATSKRAFTMFELDEIVKRYNSMISGILQYYCFVSHRSTLWKIIDIQRKSCALTIADKLKLGTANKVFYKFGRNLSIKNPVTGKEMASLSAWPKSLKSTGLFKRANKDIQIVSLIDNIENRLGTFFTKKKSATRCAIAGCQNTENLESHHLNPMVNTKRKDLSTHARVLISKKRKTVTLCRPHHMELHRRRILTQ